MRFRIAGALVAQSFTLSYCASMYSPRGHIQLLIADSAVAERLAATLRHAGFSPDVAVDVPDLLERMAARRPNVLVLDHRVVSCAHPALADTLRGTGSAVAPLSILCLGGGYCTQAARLGGCAHNADHLAMPSASDTLLSRICTLLKRPAPALAPEFRPLRVQVGRLRLGGADWQAWFDQTRAPTSARDFLLLRLLATLPSRVFSHDAILGHLGDDGAPDPERRLAQSVMALCANFAAIGCPDIIEVRPGMGYRLGSCR